MYGNWEEFNANRTKKFADSTIKGSLGHSVIMTKAGIEKVGLWDERIQSADFDLCLRVMKRHTEKGDIKPVHIALGVFNHHFIRLTLKSKPIPFYDADKIIPIEQKWEKAELDKYMGEIGGN